MSLKRKKKRNPIYKIPTLLRNSDLVEWKMSRQINEKISVVGTLTGQLENNYTIPRECQQTQRVKHMNYKKRLLFSTVPSFVCHFL